MAASLLRTPALGAARRNGAGLAASAALHVLALLLLALALRYTPIFQASPAIQVRLVRLPSEAAAERPSPPLPKRQLSPRSETAPPLALHAPPTAPTPLPIIGPAAPTPPAETGVDALRRGLRLTLGCAHPDAVDLTPQEQDACRRVAERAHAAAPSYGALTTRMQRQAEKDAAWRAYRDAPPPRWPHEDDCNWAWCHMVGR